MKTVRKIREKRRETIMRWMWWRKKVPSFTGVRHDCTKNYWGHSCHLESRSRQLIGSGESAELYYDCFGHLFPSVGIGDQVIVPFGRGPMVGQFIKVKHYLDPEDMYCGTLKMLGYLSDLVAVETTNHQVSESAKIMLEGRTRESHPLQWARGNGVMDKRRLSK